MIYALEAKLSLIWTAHNPRTKILDHIDSAIRYQTLAMKHSYLLVYFVSRDFRRQIVP